MPTAPVVSGETVPTPRSAGTRRSRVDVDPLLRVWDRWAKTPPDGEDERLIVHLEAEHRTLSVAADALREQAAAALERLEEAWRPLVATLRRWLPAAREAARAAGASSHETRGAGHPRIVDGSHRLADARRSF